MTKPLGIVTALALGSTAIAGYSFLGHAPVAHPNSVFASQSRAASPNPAAAHAAVTAKAESLVRAWAKASLHGKALGIPEADQGSYYTLKHLWGPGADGTGVNGINYFTYGAHHAVVGINEGVQLVDVRAFSPNLHQITWADIKSVMGNPHSVRHTPGSLIYEYNRGQYQLLWVFAESASQKVGAAVNHVDVEWPKGMAASMGTTPTKPAPRPASPQALVREWAHASLHGKALGIPYGDGQSYEALQHVWGSGTNGPDVNGMHYVTYGSHHAVVGFNEGMQLADVRSYNPNLHRVTLSDVEAVLGKPEARSYAPKSVVYTYNRGQYRLLWVFCGSSASSGRAAVNHVDVQWPQGMVAPMTETSPASAKHTVVRFMVSGHQVHASKSLITVTTGETVHFAPGNALTIGLVKTGRLDLYGAEFVDNSVPQGMVPLNLADWIHHWSYKFTLPGTWRFAIAPSTKVTGSVPVTITVKVIG